MREYVFGDAERFLNSEFREVFQSEEMADRDKTKNVSKYNASSSTSNEFAGRLPRLGSSE